METTSKTVVNDIDTLAAEARALLAATADVGGERVSEARKRLTAVLDKGRRIYDRARERAVEGADATNKAVHAHPYQAVAIGVGVGAVLGFLMARGCSSRRDG